MVKLSKKTKQRVKQPFKGSKFAICLDLILLELDMAYFRHPRLFDYLDLEAIGELGQHGSMCFLGQRRFIAQALTSWLAQGSSLTDASVAEWNLF